VRLTGQKLEEVHGGVPHKGWWLPGAMKLFATSKTNLTDATSVAVDWTPGEIHVRYRRRKKERVANDDNDVSQIRHAPRRRGFV
jgi:hypothetical protein